MEQSRYTPWGLGRSDSSYIVIIWALVLGLYVSISCDILAPTKIGIILSLTYLGIIVFCLKRRIFIFLLFLTLFAFYEYPRGILDLYDSVVGYEYNVITTVAVGGLPLHYWLVLSAVGLSLILLKTGYKGKAKAVILPLALLLIGLSGMVFSYLSNVMPLESLRYIKIDIKLPIMLILGVLVSILIHTPFRRKDLASFFLMLPMIMGVRAIMALVFDFSTEQINLDLGTRGIFSGCVLAYILVTGYKGWYDVMPARILLYFNLLTSSRGELVLECMLIGIGLIVGFARYRAFAVRIILELAGMLCLALIVISVINPRLIEFMYWKASEFVPGQALSGSSKVRLEEIRNIWYAIIQNPYTFLFGKGFGAHFKFNPFPFPSNELLDRMSYSDDQIAGGNYFGPHTPLGYILLKFGSVGLAFYFWIPISIIIRFWRYAEREELLFIPLVAVISLSYFWRPSECFLIGVLYGLAISMSGEKAPITELSEGT